VVDTCTHAIVHLENNIKMHDLELEERAVTITTLEQELQVLQIQAPPTPEVPAEPVVVLDVDDE
jgi:hypothetical protein